MSQTPRIRIASDIPRIQSRINPQSGMQTHFSGQTIYHIDKGLIQSAPAGPPGTPCKIIRSHAGKAQKWLIWMVQKFSRVPADLPDIPSPEPASGNEVLIDQQIQPASCTTIEGHTLCFTISGIYKWALIEIPENFQALQPTYLRESNYAVQEKDFKKMYSER